MAENQKWAWHLNLFSMQKVNFQINSVFQHAFNLFLLFLSVFILHKCVFIYFYKYSILYKENIITYIALDGRDSQINTFSY